MDWKSSRLNLFIFSGGPMVEEAKRGDAVILLLSERMPTPAGRGDEAAEPVTVRAGGRR